MAGASNFDQLRREIAILLAENEELKQTVWILQENQRIRETLQNQFNITSPSPVWRPRPRNTQAANNALQEASYGSQDYPLFDTSPPTMTSSMDSSSPFSLGWVSPYSSQDGSHSGLSMTPALREASYGSQDYPLFSTRPPTMTSSMDSSSPSSLGWMAQYMAQDGSYSGRSYGSQDYPLFSTRPPTMTSSMDSSPSSLGWMAQYMAQDGAHGGRSPMSPDSQSGLSPRYFMTGTPLEDLSSVFSSPSPTTFVPLEQSSPQSSPSSQVRNAFFAYPTPLSPRYFTPGPGDLNRQVFFPDSGSSLSSRYFQEAGPPLNTVPVPKEVVAPPQHLSFHSSRSPSPLSHGTGDYPSVSGLSFHTSNYPPSPPQPTFHPPQGLSRTLPLPAQPAPFNARLCTSFPPLGPARLPPPPRPAPFALQPPPPGRLAWKAAAPAPVPAQAAAAAAQAQDQQGPPPKDQKALSSREASSKTRSDAKESKKESMERTVGEIAFQLDRRILSFIYPDQSRLYGYSVRNIPQKVQQRDSEPYSQMTDQEASDVMERYNTIMNRLSPLGYDSNIHPMFTELVVNTFGILRDRPAASSAEAAPFNDIEHLRSLVKEAVPADMVDNCMVLLNCLYQLSQDDGKPLVTW